MSQENNNNIFIGIDVSKDNLDICYNSKHYKIKNAEKAILRFIKVEKIENNTQIGLCVLESTGGYEKLVMKLLQKACVKVHRAHPNKVYAFAKASNHFAKTDKLDSLLLCKYAAFVAEKEKGDEITTDLGEELKALKAIEFDLTCSIEANKNRMHHHRGKALSYLKKQIRFSQKQVEQIRLEIEELINEDHELCRKQSIITIIRLKKKWKINS